MPSSPSPLYGLELQADGENLNTWGQVLNAIFKRIEELIGGSVDLTVSSNITLTSDNYIQNQSRYATLKLSGDGGHSVTVPTKAKQYLVKNDCTDAVTFTHGSGDTVSVPAGQVSLIATDGADFFRAEPNDFANLKLLRVAAGTADTDGVNKGQMDTADALKANLSGGNTFAGVQNYGALLKYTSDLSGDYDARSLVDKGYVDGVAMGSVSVSFDWADVTGKPTTIAGFGITDAYTKTESDGRFFQDTIKTQWRLRP